MKKILLGLLFLIVFGLGWFYVVGKGWLGDPWSPVAPASGPRPSDNSVEHAATESQVLFGDLHTHTNYSMDAYLFNTSLVKGGGVVTPADACDFARYCSALDFWSINDHAEGLTPRVWNDTLASIRACNQRAGDPSHPDMVSFVGWEWSHTSKADVSKHYGHKNVIFRSWEEGETPTRPIGSQERNIWSRIPSAALGLISLSESVSNTADLAWYMQESRDTPLCSPDVPADQLPNDCREVALTPQSLYRKLDEWGFDALVIPHGLSWGTTNPLTANFKSQLDQHDQRYQKLLEVYSGHGSSEVFEDFERVGKTTAGKLFCPPSTENFTPCCQQAAIITRDRCEDPESAACRSQVESITAEFLASGAPKGRSLLKEATLEEWEGCGQLQNNFQPSSMYVPRMSAQHNMALGFDAQGDPGRVKMGLIGSSDGHQARPGSSYKESNRLLYTDHKDTGKSGPGADFYKADKESGGFYYTGGLVAVHATGRDRDAIWDALDKRNVYATSGDRMLVWFDLLNGPSGEVPMGSEVIMTETPKFRVRALGAFQQREGCPEYANEALGSERIQSLCGGECYNPGNERKALRRIEIVRIQPQIKPDEKIAPLIQENWKVLECPTADDGCVFEFEDPDYVSGARPTLYYARVIQEAENLIVGDPFGCEFDSEGNCIKRNYCIGANATPDKNCLAEAEPRAWSSPIFLESR
ncbi:MAG: DUF3604 domain-containing protein [Halioglobus sp.]